MDLHTSVVELKGVGAAVAEKLARLGISTIEDLLLHYPRRYEDYSRVVPIAELEPGTVTIRGVVTEVRTRRTKKHRTVTEALIADDTGEVKAIWFNQPYLGKQLSGDVEIFAAGELAFRYQEYALQNPAVERVSSFPRDTARIVPVYPQTAGVSSKQLRRLLTMALNVKTPDPIPDEIRDKYRLMPKQEAIAEIHFPSSRDTLTAARHRLAFEELYMLLILVQMIRGELEVLSAPKIAFDKQLAQDFIANLDFQLTDDQRKTAWQIVQDMESARPMNRLLQGDVGSGKTVVAALAALMGLAAGKQVAFLAPTEILARQHFENITQLLKVHSVEVELLLGSSKKAQRDRIREKLDANEPVLVIGTHALLQPDVAFPALGLLIIDEQHRFGVEQRQHLQTASDGAPHTLSMSATPIPRSLALTVYGDLDISSIRQMPPGRKPVDTHVVSNARQTYSAIYRRIQEGDQVFVVCPLIEDSDTSGLASVESEISQLRRYWPAATIEGMHGRMKADEKAARMQAFAAGEVDVLVATTVVEVGVDVAGANVILIEGAERFGLATLHQLRGRVGRSGNQAYCYLKTTASGQAKHRLELLERYSDGFTLAEKDMELRGAGELYGQRQHGIVDLRIARISDTKLIEEVQAAVKDTGDIETYPRLKAAAARLYTTVNTN